MFWWFTLESIDYKAIKSFRVNIYGVDPHVNPKPTAVVILVIFLLEVIQFGQLIASRWYKVTLLSHYAKRVMSKKTTTCLDWFYEKILAAIFRISLCSGATLSNHWKRELDQYSLLELRKGFTVDIKFLQLLGDVFGISLPKSGRKQGPSVALSPQVKSAVALSLRTNGPKLSKGLASLRRNGLEEELSWACKLETDIETILVWHIATSMCEMSPKSQELNTQSVENSKVATSLSKYCAYLLAFSPPLLPVCLLEAKELCDVAIKEARDMFEKRVSPCGKVEEVHKYEKLMDLVSDKEAGGRRSTAVQRGAKLGADLLSTVRDDGRRWKLLAEFWAEMILYLAPSNSNEMAHAEKLAEGGEFITHLWALLIHAGIVARET